MQRFFFSGLWPFIHSPLFPDWPTGDKIGQPNTARSLWVVGGLSSPSPLSPVVCVAYDFDMHFADFMSLLALLNAHQLQADCNHADWEEVLVPWVCSFTAWATFCKAPGSSFLPCKFSSPMIFPLNFFPPSTVSPHSLLQGAEIMCSSLGKQPEEAGMEMKLVRGSLQSLWQTFQPVAWFLLQE